MIANAPRREFACEFFLLDYKRTLQKKQSTILFEEKDMYYKKFKDIEISVLGFGGLRLPVEKGNPDRIDRAEAQKIIDTAIEKGINYFDTAHMYQNGDSERFLGETLKKYPRESYYLASKFHAENKTDIAATFEEQLERCQTEYFDFYLMHGVDEDNMILYMDEKKGYLDYLLQQKEAGRIRYLGFSSHTTPEKLEEFLNWYDGFDMALLQINYVDWNHLDAKGQYEVLTRHNIPVWVMEPMKGGRLSILNEKASKILKEKRPDRSVSSWGFRFLMSLPNVQTVLSGMSEVEQVLDNAKTFAEYDPLDDGELETLWRAKDAYIEDMGVPCSACRYCCPTCPAGLDIPLLIRGYNEMKMSDSNWRVAFLESAKSAAECIQCGACAKMCPQKINVPEIVKKISYE